MVVTSSILNRLPQKFAHSDSCRHDVSCAAERATVVDGSTCRAGHVPLTMLPDQVLDKRTDQKCKVSRRLTI